MTKNSALALFDFDGTITNKDSWIEFIKFTHGTPAYWMGVFVLSPMLALYVTKLIPNDRAKIFMLKYFYGGWDYEKFKKAGEDFCEQVMPGIIRPSALEKIKAHQQNGDRIILVTASGKEWVAPWCKKIGIELLSTEVEVVHHKITGKLSTPNCYGPQKVIRIKDLLQIEQYPTIYAYGDSNGDKEMLALAQHPHYKYFTD